MKKLTIPAAVASLALVLAACGGSAKSTSSGGSAKAASPSSGVLVDSSGMALYTPNGESTTNVRCTGTCIAIWKPLRPGTAKLAGSSVITRPDGTKQVAVGGKPLYTFVQDSPGSVTGNGASDAFGGKQFTWHAVKAGGASASSGSSSSGKSGGGYSYGSSSGY